MRNNNQHLENRAMASLLLLVMLFSLCGCSPSAKSEREIVADLQESEYFLPGLSITNSEIIKRQTDIRSRLDIVYVNVDASNESFECNLSYIMTYALYNEGWILDVINSYNESDWIITPLKGIDDDVIQNFINTQMMQSKYDSIEIIDRKTYLDVNQGIDQVFFEATVEHLYATETVTLCQTWYFDRAFFGFNAIQGPEEIDRAVQLSESVLGAEWFDLPRYSGTYNVFADRFDIKIRRISAEDGIYLLVKKKDIWSAYWDGLDEPSEDRMSIVCKDLTYFDSVGKWGLCLSELNDVFYDIDDSNNFNESDYFFFDLDQPENGSLQRVYSSEQEAATTVAIKFDELIMDRLAEKYAVSVANNLGVNCYDEDNPMLGVWKSTSPDDGRNDYWLIWIRIPGNNSSGRYEIYSPCGSLGIFNAATEEYEMSYYYENSPYYDNGGWYYADYGDTYFRGHIYRPEDNIRMEIVIDADGNNHLKYGQLVKWEDNDSFNLVPVEFDIADMRYYEVGEGIHLQRVQFE